MILTILGEPASKANSRIMARGISKSGKPYTRSIKSNKARNYLNDLQKQVCRIEPLLTEPLAINITIYYRTQRPDLDESVILDGLQGLIYQNDRQIREKHIYHAIDKDNPRAVIEIFLRD